MGPRSGERGSGFALRMNAGLVHASMGPRSGERGSEGVGAVRPPEKMLQWGRALVSAEGRLRAGDESRRDASMGPRSGERGSRFDNLLAAFAVVLQWGRALVSADARQALQTAQGDAASMGPRSGERGRPCATANASWMLKGFNGAALW